MKFLADTFLTVYLCLHTFPVKAKSCSLPVTVRILPFPLLLRNPAHRMLPIKYQKNFPSS